MENKDKREGTHVNAVPKAEAQEFGFDLTSLLASPSALLFLSRMLSTHLNIVRGCVTDGIIAVSGTQMSKQANCQGAPSCPGAESVHRTNARHDVLETDPTRTISVDAQVMTVKHP